MDELHLECVFFVSNGDAMCPDCMAIAHPEGSKAAGYRPVYEDGTGNDGYGLTCDCGESLELPVPPLQSNL